MLSTIMTSVICGRFRGGQRKFLAGAHSGVMRHRAVGHITIRLKLSGVIICSTGLDSRGGRVCKGTLRTLVNTVCLSRNCRIYCGFVRGMLVGGRIGLRAVTHGRIGFGSDLVR